MFIIREKPKKHLLLTQEGRTYAVKNISVWRNEFDKTAASQLMKQALYTHTSVIVAGKKPVYKVSVPNSTIVMHCTAKGLSSGMTYPWVNGLTTSAYLAQEAVLRVEMELPVTNGRGILLKDPTDRLCYYEIETKGFSQHGAKKSRLYGEALLAGLLTQYVTHEGTQPMVLFIETPMRPQTKAFMKAYEDAIKNGLIVILIHSGRPEEAEYAGTTPVWAEGERFFILKNGRKEEIELPML